MHELTIVIPYWNHPAGLKRLLASLPPDLSVIIVDDCSEIKPDSAPLQPHIRLIRLDRREYFSGAVNAGIDACETDVLVLNQDIWFPHGHGWLQKLLDMRRDYAILGDGVMKHPSWLNGYVHGVFMYLSRKAIKTVGKLDAVHWPLWGSTCEWQLRACRAGYKALPIPDLDWFEHERDARSDPNYGSAIALALKQEPEKRDLLIRTPPCASVVVATCDQARYVHDLMRSLLGGETSVGPHPGQSFAGFDVFVVDDGRDPKTAEIMQGYADPWKGVHYLKTPAPNSGTAAAMNVGIRASHAPYIQALDGDDMLAPQALGRMLAVSEEHPHSLIYCDQLWIQDAKGLGVAAVTEEYRLAQVRESKIPAQARIQNGKLLFHRPVGRYDFEVLLKRNMVPAGIMIERKAWKEVLGYPERFRWGRQDWAMAVALGQAGYCGIPVREPLYWYRREGQNRTLRNSTAEWRAIFVQQMRETFPSLYKGERPVGCCGGRKSASLAPGKGGAKVGPRVGEQGMALLEYVHENVGRTNWVGPVTGQRYTFSDTRRVGYVDTRDVPGMLDMRLGKKRAFKMYVPPQPKAEPKVSPARIIQAVHALETAVLVEEPKREPKPLTEPEIEAVIPDEAPSVKPKAKRGRKPKKAVDA